MAAFELFTDTTAEIFDEKGYFETELTLLEMYNDAEMMERFRFPRREILQLIDELREELQFRAERKGALPPAIQVLIALRFYACGAFQQVIGDLFGVNKNTVRRVIHRVSSALEGISNRYVHFNHQPEADRMKQKFHRMANMPGVIACVDGTHIKIIAPHVHEGDYVNRKGYHSLNVQLICDADLKILNAVIRWPGSVHDARMLRESEVFPQFEMIPPRLDGFILGDSGYMLRPWLLTPYLNPRDEAHERYNQAHVSTRVTIERCNGVLKRRWHCLHGELRYAPDKACSIIAACVVLHNKAVVYQLPPPVDECNARCIRNDHNEDVFEERNQLPAVVDNNQRVRGLDGRIVRDELAAMHFGRR